LIPAGGLTRVGVDAAGHYHRPLLTGWPSGWEVLALNPAHVTEQRRVMGRRRVKTDAIDLEAITELLLADDMEVEARKSTMRSDEPARAMNASRISHSSGTSQCNTAVPLAMVRSARDLAGD
jgi:transposase